jgi:hypothetical protein
MPLQPPAVAFVSYLKQNPAIRDQIRAAPGKTLLYAGSFMKPMWKEIKDLKRQIPQAVGKQTLPEVLETIRVPGTPFRSLKEYVEDTERQVPWKPDGFTVWRVVSGLFAANAVGAVSFSIGSGVNKDGKVFAATEMIVLARNPKVDALTKDILAYYERCVKNKQEAMNFGYFAG